MAAPTAADDAETAARLAKLRQMVADIGAKFPGVPVVTPAAAAAAVAAGTAVIVDTRTPAELEVSRIAGSLSPAEYEAAARRGALAGKTVVCSCTVGYRSSKEAARLAAAGQPAANLEGSILAWAHAGLPLEHGGRPTRRVHVFGADWDLLPVGRGYEAVVFSRPAQPLALAAAALRRRLPPWLGGDKG